MYIVSLANESNDNYTNYINYDSLRKYLNNATKSINPCFKIDNKKWYLVEHITDILVDNVLIKPLNENKKGDIIVGDTRYTVGKLC